MTKPPTKGGRVTLSKQREAIVEEFEDKYQSFELSETVDRKSFDRHVDWLTQALNDYTESIVRMVEEKGKEYFKTHKELMYTPYDQALNDIKEELQG